MAECIILVGLQGAGKTTLYRQRFAASHAHVSMDLFPNARNKAARLLLELARSLDEGRSVVIDNTNPTRDARRDFLLAAKQRGFRVVGYFFDVPAREAFARNNARPAAQRVPAPGLFATAKRLQPPSLDEGFDELFRVRSFEGKFEVTRLKSPTPNAGPPA